MFSLGMGPVCLVPAVNFVLVSFRGQGGAYKGLIHVIVPLTGRKIGTLTASRYWKRVSIFLGSCGIRLLFSIIYCGRPNDFHQSLRILLR